MENQILLVLHISGRTVIRLFPYILAGVALGQALKFIPGKKWMSAGSSRFRFLSIGISAILGMISPLCTYGTIPIVLAFLQAGLPLAPLVTFLAVSSLMNPQLFLFTWFWIGPEMALVRAAAVLILGLLLGVLLLRFPKKWIINPSVFLNRSGQAQQSEDISTGFRWPIFLRRTWSSLQFVGFYMVIGILLGAVVEVFVPGAWLLALFKPGQFSSVLFAALLGVPLYPCGGGTLPLIRSLILKGMSKGAALTFFIVGPATRVTPLMALATVLRPVFLVFYILSLIGYSLIAGILYH